MTPKQKTMAWLGGGVALMVVGTAVMFVMAKSCTIEPPPKLVLSKETTWFTGPLRADGGIDWVAAIEAEARANGLTDAENGAPLLKEALKEFVDAREHIVHKQRFKLPTEETSLDGAFEQAVEALENGKLDALNVDLLLEWLDEVEPALEMARQAAERKEIFEATLLGPREAFPRLDDLEELDDSFDLSSDPEELFHALRLRVATRVAHADVEGALSDAAATSALSRATGSPADFDDQCIALGREVALLELLVRSVQGERALPADRVLALVESRPPRWNGEVALKEALRSMRLFQTCMLDAKRLQSTTAPLTRSGRPDPTPGAMARVDLNPRFLRLQKWFDDVEALLLGSDRPALDRIDAFNDKLRRQIETGTSIGARGDVALGFLLQSDERIVDGYFDLMLLTSAAMLQNNLAEWLALTARRDALLAELAARAGAPERRDSWLGQRLIATKQPDGTIVVSGPLIDLARERGVPLDEEE